MRTLEEVQRELDEVEAQIKAQQEGMPNYGDPGYRAARFDYIVDGDRSGLDAYQTALNTAIQNKLNRESSEYMAELNKGEADLEKDDEIVQHLRDTDAVIDDLKKRNYSDDSVEMKKAKNEQDYWLRRADRRGLNVSLYRETPKPASVDTPAAPQSAPQGRSYKDLSSYLTTIKDDKTVNKDKVKALRAELDLHRKTVPFEEFSNSINLLNAKDKELSDSEWNEYNSRVKAALGEKDYGKRKDALEPLKEELANYKGQEKYAEVEKSINDGLKKPAPDPLTRAVVRQNFSKNDIISLKGEIDKSKDKGITRNISVGNRNRTLTFKTDKDGNVLVLNEKGREVDKFTKGELTEFDTANKVEVPDTPIVNPVAKSLAGESKFPNGRIIVGPGEDW